MCTRVLWHDSGQGVLVGRNMDWLQDMGTHLWVMPSGAERIGIENDPNPLRWTAEHGSVIATAYDQAATDGMNEQGLAAHLLWLAESDYGPRNVNLPAVSVSQWAQLFLDRFSSVSDCIAFMRSQPFQVRPQADPFTNR